MNAFSLALHGPKGDAPTLGGCGVRLLDDRMDLAALNPALSQDILSTFLRQHWIFRSNKFLSVAAIEDGISQMLITHEPSRVHNLERIRHFEERSLSLAVNTSSTITAAVLLIGPILAFYFVTSAHARLAMVILFIVLFAVGLAVTTGASRDGVFAATAAYTALLVVFVSGNLGNAHSEG